LPGKIIYKGPSLLDSQPIFVAAIWGSGNRKTGDMLQTYVMRQDLDPLLASKLGEDASICGDCKHRGEPTLDPDRKIAERRSCYVNLGQGPLIVWRNYKAGKYPLSDNFVDRALVGSRRFVRLGTYGDPAAVHKEVWHALLSLSDGYTGYTHNNGDTATCMVSADTRAEADTAWAAGQRTFRIIRHVGELVPKREVLCPASKEAGYRSTCAKCLLCNGSQGAGKSVAIVAHGQGRGFV
jgi:hypothetical protein